ncbi:MAG: GTP-binding protein [Thermoplasmata archaeon]|nr:MAG: GTP-binding protein [Thermoplasmata archaeon]
MKFKVCLIGEGAVGKTSLIRKFVHDIFEDRYITSIGMKATKKTVRLVHPQTDEPVEILLIIWDIMGQPAFRNLLGESYFFGANGILATCDITKRDTLYALQEWVKVAFEASGEVPIVFLGNKCDLADEQEVFLGDIEVFASNYGNASVFLSSAKTGENVESAFQKLGKDMLKNMVG